MREAYHLARQWLEQNGIAAGDVVAFSSKGPPEYLEATEYLFGFAKLPIHDERNPEVVACKTVWIYDTLSPQWSVGFSSESLVAPKKDIKGVRKGHQRGQDSFFWIGALMSPDPFDFSRLSNVDPLLGKSATPITWHRYMYAFMDPISNIDPTGAETLASLGAGMSVGQGLNTQNAGARVAAYQSAAKAGRNQRGQWAKPKGSGLINAPIPKRVPTPLITFDPFDYFKEECYSVRCFS